jgi:hypothetical protein
MPGMPGIPGIPQGNIFQSIASRPLHSAPVHRTAPAAGPSATAYHAPSAARAEYPHPGALGTFRFTPPPRRQTSGHWDSAPDHPRDAEPLSAPRWGPGGQAQPPAGTKRSWPPSDRGGAHHPGPDDHPSRRPFEDTRAAPGRDSQAPSRHFRSSSAPRRPAPASWGP